MKSLIRSLALIVVGVLFLTASTIVRASVLPISGAVFWLDATNIDGSNDSTLSNGNHVATWTDLSGSGDTLTQINSTQQPTYVTNVLNGLPVVRFDGVNDALINNILSTNITGNDRTVFVVLKANKITDHTAPEQDFFNQGPAGSTSYLVSYFNQPPTISSPPGGANIFRGLSGGNVENDNYTSGQYIVFGSVWQGGVINGSTLYIDGDHPVSGTLAAFTNSTSLSLGANIGGGNGFYNGDVAEVIVYDSALNSTDFTAVNDYLADKWDVPEPASLSLVVVGGAVLLKRRRA